MDYGCYRISEIVFVSSNNQYAYTRYQSILCKRIIIVRNVNDIE